MPGFVVLPLPTGLHSPLPPAPPPHARARVRTRLRARTSTSDVVATSITTSYSATSSPSAFSQRAMLPCVMVGESLGMGSTIVAACSGCDPERPPPPRLLLMLLPLLLLLLLLLLLACGSAEAEAEADVETDRRHAPGRPNCQMHASCAACTSRPPSCCRSCCAERRPTPDATASSALAARTIARPAAAALLRSVMYRRCWGTRQDQEGAVECAWLRLGRTRVGGCGTVWCTWCLCLHEWGLGACYRNGLLCCLTAGSWEVWTG